MNDDHLKFQAQVNSEINNMISDSKLKEQSFQFINDLTEKNYSYHFTWMGIPIIQFPQDIIAMQELIFEIEPDLIIETGIARGGSIIFYASMMELLGNNGKVIGIDIDIREHNKKRVQNHKMYKNIKLIEGSSIAQETIEQVDTYINGHNFKKILVVLDSNHTEDHVAKELELYHQYVKKGSYLVVFDTIIEHLTKENLGDRPWGKGNNPKTAVKKFLEKNNRFKVDESIESKLLITVAPSGYLKCID